MALAVRAGGVPVLYSELRAQVSTAVAIALPGRERGVGGGACEELARVCVSPSPIPRLAFNEARVTVCRQVLALEATTRRVIEAITSSLGDMPWALWDTARCLGRVADVWRPGKVRVAVWRGRSICFFQVGFTTCSQHIRTTHAHLLSRAG